MRAARRQRSQRDGEERAPARCGRLGGGDRPIAAAGLRAYGIEESIVALGQTCRTGFIVLLGGLVIGLLLSGCGAATSTAVAQGQVAAPSATATSLASSPSP